MEVKCAPLLYAHPPESGERPVLPLQTFAEGLQMPLADLRIFRVFVGIGKGYGDELSLEAPEGPTVDAGKASQKIPAAFAGEPFYLLPDTPAIARTGIDLTPASVILQGDTRYRTSYGIGEVGITLL